MPVFFSTPVRRIRGGRTLRGDYLAQQFVLPTSSLPPGEKYVGDPSAVSSQGPVPTLAGSFARSTWYHSPLLAQGGLDSVADFVQRNALWVGLAGFVLLAVTTGGKRRRR